MKFSISPTTFRDGLSRVASNAKGDKTLPILSNVLLDASAGILTLSTTNLEQSSQVRVECQVKEEGKTTLPTSRLLSVLQTIGEDEVRIEVNENHVGTLQAGTALFKLAGLPPDEFPGRLFEGANEKRWTFNPAELRNTLIQLQPVASSDPGRYILNGVWVNAKEGQIEWAATDGRAMCIVATQNEGPDGKAILPNEFVRQVIRALDEETEVVLSVVEQGVSLIGKFFTLSSLQLNGEYPISSLHRAFPSTATGQIQLERESFLKLLRKLASVGADSSKEVLVRIEGTRNNLDIAANRGGQNESSDSLPVKLDAPFHCTINHRFLDAVLRNVADDTVTMEYIDHANPLVFRSTGVTSCIQIMRVND